MNNLVDGLAKRAKHVLCLVIVAAMAVHAHAGKNEIAATVESIDISGNTVVLHAIDIPSVTYTFAYDVRIQLRNGDQGAVGNVRAGDVITALVETDDKVIEALFVVGP